MAINYWIGGTGSKSWGDTANWSLGAVPVNTNDVVIANASSLIDTGLAQSAVTLASLVVDSSFTGTIGTAATPLAISATVFRVGEEGIGAGQAGSGRVHINFGTNQFTGVIGSTGQALDTGLQAVRIKGTHASNALNVTGNSSVGVATTTPAETATLAFLTVGPGADVELGQGVTWSLAVNSGGTLYTYSGGTTLETIDGTTVTRGVGNIDTVIARGGTTYINHRAGAGNDVDDLNFTGGTVDLTTDGRGLTSDNVSITSGSLLTLYPTQLTVATGATLTPNGANQMSFTAA